MISDRLLSYDHPHRMKTSVQTWEEGGYHVVKRNDGTTSHNMDASGEGTGAEDDTPEPSE